MFFATIPVTLTLVGPILTRSSAVSRTGLDAPVARDSAGRYYLPYSLVRGRLRQAWEELTSMGLVTDGATIQRRLGPWPDPEPKRQSWDPERGNLRFSDFVHRCTECEPLIAQLAGALRRADSRAPTVAAASQAVAEAQKCHDTGDHGRAVRCCRRAAVLLDHAIQDIDVRYRIRIDPARGAADEGALQTIESPFRPGVRAEFRGAVEFFCATDTDVDAIHTELDRGFRWITSFGAERTVGFGRLDAVEVAKPELVSNAATVDAETSRYVPFAPLAPAGPDAAEQLELELRFRESFCVTRRQPNRNLFESDRVVSGGALKGALAWVLNAAAGRRATQRIDGSFPEPWRALGRHFDKLRFTHAFPSRGDRRPVVPPLSLVQFDEGRQWRDVALCERVLLGTPRRAPAFAVDWKDRGRVDEHFGWAEPQRELRVHTAINRTTRSAHEDHLFAYELVVPKGFIWRARLDLGDVEDSAERAEVERQLRSIFELVGFWGLGKTKARADVTVNAGAAAPVWPSSFAVIAGHTYVVTLQTPALLCDARQLDETGGEAELRGAYEATWNELWRIGAGEHPGASWTPPRLVRYFASQTLFGGYLVRRFRGRARYRPYVLTDPGSVFVFETADQDAAIIVRECLERWHRKGLPLPAWATDLYGDDPFTCPFRPQEGFGEVAVNLCCHVQNAPAPGEWNAI